MVTLSWLDSTRSSAVQMSAYASQVAPLASVTVTFPFPDGSTWTSRRTTLQCVVLWVHNLRHHVGLCIHMVTELAPAGISGRNRRLLTTLHRSVSGPFSVEEAASALFLSIPRTHRLLAYLADRGWLLRLRRGLYSLVPLEAAHAREWVEDPWVVASKLYGADSYIGGWSACEHWDLTEQIFMETVVITSRKLRSAKDEVQGFSFRVKRTKPDMIFGVRTVWRGRTRVNVSDASRTVADVLSDPSLGGGIRHVGDVLETYFESEHLDEDLLVGYVDRLGNRTAFKRLGYLAETLDVGSPAFVRRCQEGMSSGTSLLDPSLPAAGPYLRRWNLRVNANVSPEGHLS